MEPLTCYYDAKRDWKDKFTEETRPRCQQRLHRTEDDLNEHEKIHDPTQADLEKFKAKNQLKSGNFSQEWHFCQTATSYQKYNQKVLEEGGICQGLVALWIAAKMAGADFRPDQVAEARDLRHYNWKRINNCQDVAGINYYSQQLEEQINRALAEHHEDGLNVNRLDPDHPPEKSNNLLTGEIGSFVSGQFGAGRNYIGIVMYAKSDDRNVKGGAHSLGFAKLGDNEYRMFDGNIGEYSATSVEGVIEWADTLVNWERRPYPTKKGTKTTYKPTYVNGLPKFSAVQIKR